MYEMYQKCEKDLKRENLQMCANMLKSISHAHLARWYLDAGPIPCDPLAQEPPKSVPKSDRKVGSKSFMHIALCEQAAGGWANSWRVWILYPISNSYIEEIPIHGWLGRCVLGQCQDG